MYVDQKNKYNKIISSSLVNMIESTSATDISVTDMTMLAHIVDCCENVHLPINKLFLNILIKNFIWIKILKNY